MRGWKFRLSLWKAYLDTGRGLTDYIKYFIVVGGFYAAVGNISFILMMTILVFYLIISYIIGWIYIKFGFLEAQQEVSNEYNLFCKQVRNSLKNPKRQIFKKH